MRRIIILISIIFSFHVNVNAQNYLTIGEIFDFEIGDEFHYREYSFYQNAPPKGDIEIVTSKHFSANMDTVFYSYSKTHFYSEFSWATTPPLTYTFSYSTYSNYYWNLTDTITDVDSGFQNDTIVYTDSSNTLINGYAYSVGTFEPDSYWGYYGKGIGVADEGYAIPSNEDVDGRKMVYYSKTGYSWGKPFDIVDGVKDVLSDGGNFKIYPNPFNNILSVSSNTPNGTIEIYTVNGELVKKIQIFELKQNIDMTGVSSGIYVIKHFGNSQVSVQKIIKL